MMNEQNNNPQAQRVTPRSELDLNLLITDSVWGSPHISSSLKDKLEKYYASRNEKGQTVITSENLWELLGFYTRDLRLANLSTVRGELQYCQYYLDLANDFLQAGYIEPFLICISRVATITELSQSKGGFLRRGMNTLRHENVNQELEPKKKTLFGKAKED